MKMRCVCTAAAMMLAAGSAVSAQSLSTGFTGGFIVSATATDAGNMFDVSSYTSGGLTINSFDIHSEAAALTPITVSVYYKAGTFLGSNSTAAAWTLNGTYNVIAAGPLTATPVALAAPIAVPAGETYGIYISVAEAGASVRYYGADERPNTNPANDDLSIDVRRGISLAPLFNTGPFSARGWNGTVHYTASGTAGTGACCRRDGTCVEVTQGACVAAGGAYQGDASTCGAATCTTHVELESNNNKSENNPFTLADGHILRGQTTGTTTTAASTLLTTVDYYRIKTPPAPLGIYRHQMTVSNPAANNSSWIRGRSQTAATAGTWPGPVGTMSATENTAQSHILSGTDRTNIWYGFGREEEMYYRVSGATTSGEYSASVATTQVTAPNVGSFAAGQITITTTGQGHTSDTAIRVYDSNLNQIEGFANNNASLNGGAPAAVTTSFLQREFAAGTYYLALTIGDLATDQGVPCDDGDRTSVLMDFPHIAVNVGTSTLTDVSFAVTDGAGTVPVVAARGGRGDIAWYTFTVTGTIATGGCCFADGTCQEMTQAQCGTASGVYAGNNVTCAAANCAQPGACCFPDGTCTFVLETACTGTWTSAGTTCAAANCPQPGACCLPSGCVVLSQADCLASGGTYSGHGVTCAAANCPAPTVGNIVGFNFTTAAAATPDPQNWNRISAVTGTASNVQDDMGLPTNVGIEWTGQGGTSAGLLYLGTATLGAGAVPQYTYDLSGMTGYGFRASGDYTVTLSGLTPSRTYEYWVVGYRATAAYTNHIQVSSGDVLGAVTFDQIQTTPNDGRFVVNEVNADNTMQWNTLANSTTSSSTGTITFHGAPEPATGTVVIGALAIREVFPTGPQCYANCDESTQNPILNVADFTCFLQRFAAGDSYANCDNSTQEPILNVADFTCFLQSFAAGCP